MGQIYSREYSCETNGSGDDCSKRGRGIEDVGDSELNTSGAGALSSSSASSTGKRGPNWQVRAADEERQQHVRKLSNVSHRNIQLLSMKPRSEKDAYADDLRTRRRSSLINLILGAPSSGPRFCDDLCSLSSHISEVYFGIESFSEPRFGCGSTSTLRLASIEDTERAEPKIRPSATAGVTQNSQKLPYGRRSSFGSLATISDNPIGKHDSSKTNVPVAPSSQQDRRLSRAKSRNPSLASTLASIDLTSSFEQHGDKLSRNSQIPLPIAKQIQKPPLVKSRPLENDIPATGEFANDIRTRVSRSRINQTARIIRRTGSELSLYSTISASSIGSGSHAGSTGTPESITQSLRRETKLIILLQVALPFILAGFGNMAAGLVLESVSRKRAFSSAPILFVLLPSLVGLKGNIEMTLASRFSTLSNLNLLDTSQRRIRAYASNLTLVVSQAIGLSLFAAAVSIICELSIFGTASSGALANLSLGGTTLAVSASALTTSVALVILSSIVVSSAVALANLIQVNPDNLSTLIAALYGDVSCVFVYGLVAERMFDLVERNLLTWPLVVVIATLVLWPISLYLSYKFKETHSVALYSMPPMIISILISMGSGSLLSLFVGRFKLIALYQPVVNGFGANLVAVQASRVTTWLWCSALSKLPTSDRGRNELPSKMIGSLASFDAPKPLERKSDNGGGLLLVKLLKMISKSVRLFLWSFCNSSPNAIAARLLLIMLIPAHTIYFFVIWLISAASHVVITWQFYTVYIGLCLVQVFILLVICEPFMTLLMNRNLDPDVFGISILMAVADLTGTICLTLAFFLLSSIGDVNAMQ